MLLQLIWYYLMLFCVFLLKTNGSTGFILIYSCTWFSSLIWSGSCWIWIRSREQWGWEGWKYGSLLRGYFLHWVKQNNSWGKKWFHFNHRWIFFLLIIVRGARRERNREQAMALVLEVLEVLGTAKASCHHPGRHMVSRSAFLKS